MNKYEELLEEAASQDISVDENFPFNGSLKGLYIDRNIALSDSLKITAEKTSILAEELGHHYTSFGNILDPSDITSKKQEQKTRLWSYDRLFGLKGIIDAFLKGYREFHEVAEYLEVTEEQLREAVESYRAKYGTYTTCGDYYLIFEPYLMVGKRV
ncbi:MAG: hypothetical protein J5983_00770 [Ruminococcus sp.]|nr:hypothetical protein [Ruminococcus sp.]